MSDPARDINPGDVLSDGCGELWLVLDVTTPDDGVPTVRYKPVGFSLAHGEVWRFTGWPERVHTLAMVREYAPEKVDPKLAADVLRWWRGS